MMVFYFQWQKQLAGKIYFTRDEDNEEFLRHHLESDDSVISYLLCTKLIRSFLPSRKIIFYHNIPHVLQGKEYGFLRHSQRSPFIQCASDYAKECGDSSRRMWSLDYPFSNSEKRSKGCGVSVFAIGSEEEIFDLMMFRPDLRVVREVIMHCTFPGFTRFYIDWDEISDGQYSNRLVEIKHIKDCVEYLTGVFKSFFGEAVRARIQPLWSTTYRPGKISFHLVFSGICFRYKDEYRRFDQQFRESLSADCQHHVDPTNNANKPQRFKHCLAFKRTVFSRKAMSSGYLEVLDENGVVCPSAFAMFRAHLAWASVDRGDFIYGYELSKSSE
jgi:hypothetical protein